MNNILSDIIKAFTIHFFTEAVRYVLFAGGTFLIFWVLLRHKLAHRIIQNKLSNSKQLKREFLFSMSSIAVFFAYRSRNLFCSKGRLWKNLQRHTRVWTCIFYAVISTKRIDS
jgi:hypothetical protein